MLRDFVSLFFPNNCPGCHKPLFKNERIICIQCRAHLPHTNFHSNPKNVVAKQFWGKTEIQGATSLLFFNKGSIVQNLLHELKYKGNKEVGHELGKMLGLELKDTPAFQQIDFVVPIPLHPKKLKERGYNQSDFIAQGVGEAMGVTVLPQALVRVQHSDSQTRKSRFDRWENVKTVFQVAVPEELSNKHVLLVDDVVTTGSTLEGCAQPLLMLENTKVSIATVACA